MRKFTALQAAAAIAMVTPPAAAARGVNDPLAMNVGDCGCGGSCNGNAQFCTPRPPIPPGFTPEGGGYVWQGPGNPPPGDPSIVPVTLPPGTTLPPAWGMPETIDAARYSQYLARMNCVPYKDAIRDCIMMKTIASAPTAVGIGATVNVDVAPAQGWFDAYYIDVVAWLTGGIDAGPDSFNMSQPTVVGCPPSACDTGVAINRYFYAARDACCCGRPFRAVVPSPSSAATPLRTAITNLNAAAITAQVIVRGFCYSGRICV